MQMTTITDDVYKAFRREFESNKWDILSDEGTQLGRQREESTRAGLEAAITTYLAAIEPKVRERVRATISEVLTIALVHGDPVSKGSEGEALVLASEAKLLATLFGLEAE